MSVRELTIEANTDNLAQVIAFLDQRLEELDCPIKIQMQMDVAVEEIFVNVAQYAYADRPDAKEGKVTIRIEDLMEPACVEVTFTDSGLPFDPLAREDPDVTLSAEQRKIGGLGIFLVKKSMDEMKYEYKDGKNILKLRKLL